MTWRKLFIFFLGTGALCSLFSVFLCARDAEWGRSCLNALCAVINTWSLIRQVRLLRT